MKLYPCQFLQAQLLLLTGFLFSAIHVPLAQTFDPKISEVWEPVPPIVSPGLNHGAPSDAIVLFSGEDTNAWTHLDGSSVQWKLEEGAMTVSPGSGNIQTKESFGDIQLHIEFRTPEKVNPEETGQERGNSGVFLQSRYEIQILDNYRNSTYPNGQAGSVYKQYIPLVNACLPPGAWQTYDIIFIAPRFNEEGIRTNPGTLTVLHNGVLIQHHVRLIGTTEYKRMPQNEAHRDAPIQLQDHGNLVSYRNIWVRKL